MIITHGYDIVYNGLTIVWAGKKACPTLESSPYRHKQLMPGWVFPGGARTADKVAAIDGVKRLIGRIGG